MRYFLHIILLLVISFVTEITEAGNYNETVVSGLSRQEKFFFSNLKTLSSVSLKKILYDSTSENLKKITKEILDLGDLSIGGRKYDEKGRAPIHYYLLKKIEELKEYGVEYVGSIKGMVAVPVSVNEGGGLLEIEGKEFKVLPFWPNGAMPNLCPTSGISGHLVYVASGSWAELDGLDLNGAIALMDFKGGRNWDRLFMLGVKACIVIDDGFVSQPNAYGLFCATPVPFPRFYVDKDTGNDIMSLYNNRKKQNSDGKVYGKLKGGNIYENRYVESIFAYLPPTPPVKYIIREGDLLDRICVQFNVSREDVIKENKLNSVELKEGDVIDIPGTMKTYKVTPNDLITRIGADFGVDGNVILQTNNIKAIDVKPGVEIIIPNIDDTLVILVRIDSVCSVPDAPHGAIVAANIASAITILEHLASTPDIVRRYGLLVGFLDGDNYGGIASRLLTEHTLLTKGNLKSSLTKVETAGRGFKRFITVLFCSVVGVTSGILIIACGKKVIKFKPVYTKVFMGFIVVISVIIGIRLPLPSEDSVRSSEEDILAKYQEAMNCFKRGEASGANENTLRWLVDTWIATQFEKVRVNFAEERVKYIIEQINYPSRSEDLKRKIEEIEAKIDIIRKFRDSTFAQINFSYAERFSSFIKELKKPENEINMRKFRLDYDSLLELLLKEYEEEKEWIDLLAGNNVTVNRLIGLLHPSSDPSRKNRSVPGWLLFLTDGTHTVTTSVRVDGRQMPVKGNNISSALEDKYYKLLAYAYVNGGWQIDWPYFGSSFHPEFSVFREIQHPPVYAEFWEEFGVALTFLTTINDYRNRLDTPYDIIDRLNFDNISIQLRTLLVFFRALLESPLLVPDAGFVVRTGNFGRLLGKVVKFNIRSGIDAQEPVSRCYVIYPAIFSKTGTANSLAMAGTRPGIVMITRLNGTFTLPLESITFHNKYGSRSLYAYHFDKSTALFNMVYERARIGTKKEPPQFKLLSGQDTEKKLILTAGTPFVIFADTDPVNYNPVPNPRAVKGEPLKIVDVILNGPPKHYGMDHPLLDYGETDISAIILYAPYGKKLRISVEEAMKIKFLLTGGLEEDTFKCRGYSVGSDSNRNGLALHLTPLYVARDMHEITVRRRDQYARYGVKDSNLDIALIRSLWLLKEAEEYIKKFKWQEGFGTVREAWGILAKNYPVVIDLARQAVFSVVFIMAVLLPCSIFLERLVVYSRGIILQIIVTAIIFLCGVIYLRLFHPAFEIVVSPFVVVIAFIMILMSVIVLGLCYQKFNIIMRRVRITAGEAESEEISLVSSLATAISLGVSNLRKRRMRTFLTVFTVSVLTFSIITFVSVKGRQSFVKRNIEPDPDIEGEMVECIMPTYNGIMIRDFNWRLLNEGFVSSFETEYGKKYRITKRGYFIESEGGNNADREGVNQIEVRYGKNVSVVNGIMVFEPEEIEFSGLNRAVSRGIWFKFSDIITNPLERFQVILPDNVASELGIGEDMIFDSSGCIKSLEELPVVNFMNIKWYVIGILNTKEADRIRDVNGKSLAMVDYLRSGITPNVPGHLENEMKTYHCSWKRFVIVPSVARNDIKAKWRSMIVKFKSEDNINQFLDNLAMRYEGAMFACIDNKFFLLTTKIKRSVSGIAKVVVPVLLCILVVANTMLGAVDERKPEVGMLAAVGLSPAQISFLFLSEASVYSVLGIVAGMFAGIGFSSFIIQYPEVFGSLSINFTSLASTFLAFTTGIVVLIATLFPAKKAARMAAPSGMEKWELPQIKDGKLIDFVLPFTLTEGNAVGMLYFLRRFFLNHTEVTSRDFNCRNITVTGSYEPDVKFELSCIMWLEPYDLDVAQETKVVVFEADTEGIFGVRIILRKLSGSEDSFARTNYAFIDLLRYQFLIWRNLKPELRERIIREGVKLIENIF